MVDFADVGGPFTSTTTGISPIVEGLRRWRRQFERGRLSSVLTGERMMIRCEGGPNAWRAASFPPPGEFEVPDGSYVLIDDGPPEAWAYEFVRGRAAR